MACDTSEKISFNYDTFKVSFGVTLEMMEDRGYKSFEIPISNKKEFKNEVKNNEYISVITFHEETLVKCLIAWFPISKKDINIKKLNTRCMAILKDKKEKEEINEILIITDRDITINALKIIETEREVFEVKRFIETQFNVTKHELVPLHSPLDESEVQEFVTWIK